MRHSISQNICLRFFGGLLIAVFGVVSLLVSSPAFAVAPNQNPVKIFSEDFESGTSKWKEFHDQITTTQVHSGTKALRYDGWPGVYADIPTTREVYLRYWWYMPTGFDGGHAGGRHFWRLGTNGAGHQIDTQAQSEPNGFSVIYFLGGEVFYPDVTQLPRGRWFKFEFYTRLNDPGVANGVAKVWIDGVPQLNETNVNLGATSDNLDELLLTTNYADCSGVCDWFMDDVEVWNGCPSGSSCNAGSSPANLSPPSNLKVVP